MPCQYYSPEHEKRTLQQDLNILTRVSCDMRTIIRRHNLQKELTQETIRWIKQHDKEDEKRIREETENGIREKTKREALKKLTLEERRALGL